MPNPELTAAYERIDELTEVLLLARKVLSDTDVIADFNANDCLGTIEDTLDERVAA